MVAWHGVPGIQSRVRRSPSRRERYDLVAAAFDYLIALINPTGQDHLREQTSLSHCASASWKIRIENASFVEMPEVFEELC